MMETAAKEPEECEPILQILGAKRFNRNGDSERYRLLLSDGKYMQSFCVLTTRLNGPHSSRDLTDYTIIRVKNYNTVGVNDGLEGKRVLIIINLEIVHRGDTVGRRIGYPVHL